MSIERKPNKWMERIVLGMIRIFLESRSNIVIKQNDTLQMKPPYIILANHVNNWDQFFINCYVKEAICFVAGDSLFRNRYVSKLLHYTGAIPKTKFKKDTSTIRNILKAKRNNRIIAIFPEGNRNWDGVTEPITYTTSKLVKSLHIPVVIAKIEGGHLSHPRWAARHRNGLISISMRKLWDVQDLQEKGIEDIHKELSEALAHDEVEWQEVSQASYSGKHPAQYLERLLFTCPHCYAIATLRSKDDKLFCQDCSYTVRYTTQGSFEEVQHPIQFVTTRDWNRWQQSMIDQFINNPSWKQKWQQALKDQVKLYISEENKVFQFIANGYIEWRGDGLAFQAEQGENQLFPLEEMEGLNVQLHHNLEFHIGEHLYRIVFYQPHTSAYKWLKVMQAYSSL